MRLHWKNTTPLPRTPENLSQYGGRGGRQRKGGVALFKKPSELSDYVAMTAPPKTEWRIAWPEEGSSEATKYWRSALPHHVGGQSHAVEA